MALVEHIPPLAVERLEHPVPKSTRVAWAVREAEITKLQLKRQMKLSESAWEHAALANCGQVWIRIPIDDLEREDRIFV